MQACHVQISSTFSSKIDLNTLQFISKHVSFLLHLYVTSYSIAIFIFYHKPYSSLLNNYFPIIPFGLLRSCDLGCHGDMVLNLIKKTQNTWHWAQVFYRNLAVKESKESRLIWCMEIKAERTGVSKMF